MPRGTVKQTGKVTSGGFVGGRKLYHQRASQAFPLLVRQAIAEQPIYYSELAKEIGMPNERNLNYVLGAIGGELKSLAKKWRMSIPPIPCLVINKHTHLPGNGIAWFVPNPKTFLKKDRAYKRKVMKMMLAEVYSFDKWDRILDEFGLKPAQSIAPPTLIMSKKIRFGTGTGEGDDHKRLKDYIATHPEKIGLPMSAGPGTTEFEFASADTIDVLFTYRSQWIGIEVKGAQSDDADVMRGLFQCIKYKVLIEAQQKFQQVQVNSRVVLVLGRPFPGTLLGLKHTLGINVIENVEIP